MTDNFTSSEELFDFIKINSFSRIKRRKILDKAMLNFLNDGKIQDAVDVISYQIKSAKNSLAIMLKEVSKKGSAEEVAIIEQVKKADAGYFF